MKDLTTKEKILDAAENLFVDNGFAATSLRAIIKEADVNTAAVHYHFGSKEGLIEAVFDRRVSELNQERLEMLDALEAEHGDRPVPLEDVIRVFLLPVMRRHCAGGNEEVIPRLMVRALTEPEAIFHGPIRDAFKEVAARFGRSVGRAMPGLSREEIEWRMHMVVGAMVFTVVTPRIHPEKAKRFTWSRNPDEVTERLVRFLSAGMRAQMPEAAGKDSN
jgi:AcrR family transcriptional regulator